MEVEETVSVCDAGPIYYTVPGKQIRVFLNLYWGTFFQPQNTV